MSQKPAASQMQVQALFGGAGKRAQKTAKTGTQKTGGLAKQAQRIGKQVCQTCFL